MANLCSFTMKIVGRRDNREKFIKALQQQGNIYMGRGATAYPAEETKEYCILNGDCKWSVASALINNAVSMRRTPEKWFFGNSIQTSMITFITLIEASKIYNVEIEVFSEEPGCAFAEHYLIKEGNVIENECVDYYEYYLGDFETKEETEKEYGIKIPDEVWEHEDYYRVGGFDQQDWSI